MGDSGFFMHVGGFICDSGFSMHVGGFIWVIGVFSMHVGGFILMAREVSLQ